MRIPVLSILLAASILPPPVSAQTLDFQAELDRVRADVFVRMIRDRGVPGKRILCLGMGGKTTPIHDPSPGVIEQVSARADEYRYNPAFVLDVRPMSRCTDENLRYDAPPLERAQPFLLVGLSVMANETSMITSGHASLDEGEVYDCRLTKHGDRWEFDRCGAMHDHFGTWEAKWTIDRERRR